MYVDNSAILPATGRRAPIPPVRRLLALASALLFPACLLAETDTETLIPDTVRAAAEERIAKGHYQSLIVGVRADGHTEWASFGQLSDGGPPPRPDTVYEIGSLTKPFTAALLSLAVEQGHMDIDDTVGKHAPEDRELDRRLRDDVALWQLATHVSGLPDTPDDLSPNDPSRLFEDYSEEALWRFLARHPLASQPGANYAYSNLAYALLGKLLAETLDDDYESLLASRITTPLGLDSTAISPRPAVLDRLAPGFDYDLSRAPSWTWSAFQAAGALRSTPEDLMRWIEAHLSPSDDDLGRALRRLYWQELKLGENGQAMGLGWQLMTDKDTLTAWHSGRSAGYASFIAFQPDAQRAVVILANTGNSVEHLGFALLDPEREPRPIRPAEPLDPRLGALYAGRYRLSPAFVLTVRQTSNGLFIRAPGRPPLRLYSVDGERFFTRGVDSEVRFVEGQDGGAIEGIEIQPPRGDIQFAHRMQQTESPAPREITAVSQEELQNYAGTYRVNGSMVFNLQPDADRLLLTSGSGPVFPLYPAADGRFFHRNQPLELHFTGQGEGETGDGLILYRNGYALEARRVGNKQD